jgi:hypothetical protein
MMRTRLRATLVLLAVATCRVVPGVAANVDQPTADQPTTDQPTVIRLTAIDSYAPTALWTHVFLNYFIPEVDRRLAESGNYQIRWNKAFGGEIIQVSPAQRQAWAAGLPNIASAWADELESRGLPGDAILRDYMDTMRANDQPIVRHWDRE